MRTDSNPHITASSTFKDRATAERIANSVLNDPKNIKKIENWIDDLKTNVKLQGRWRNNRQKCIKKFRTSRERYKRKNYTQKRYQR
ncbi:hypothetical protein MTN95_00770 [Bacillus sp. 2CMS4F]|uniref:RNase A-like domain-containing protein n=1 Tax=Bacillus sp. 2CMS4F TaxID=2929170 RepID=UPI0020BDF948|nr:RNase A-like domain-containing protein [Bacillus sp. 2CMS4F]MCK8097928.1 hypothetical protein [Bacillus sp. 2CMS4F]